MEIYTKSELEAMITRAYAQRKAAYKARFPKFVTTAINHQIWQLNEALAKVGA